MKTTQFLSKRQQNFLAVGAIPVLCSCIFFFGFLSEKKKDPLLCALIQRCQFGLQ
jgi:hypothetical protein